MQTFSLHNGVRIPALGLGVFQITDLKECERTVLQALDLGYRLIDTAQSYKNEEAVGNAIAKSAVPREALFVTTKLKIVNLTYEKARASFFDSLSKLKLDYLDMLLIHHPYHDIYGAWRAMRELYHDGYVRAIGISNFPPNRLEDLVLFGEEKPHLMQIEIHPFHQQKESMDLMKKYDIQAQAWSPLAQCKLGLLENELLCSIAEKHQKSVPQIVLRWHLQRDIVTIVKSVHAQRLAENLSIFDFELTDEEMQQITALEKGETVVPKMLESSWVHTASSF